MSVAESKSMTSQYALVPKADRDQMVQLDRVSKAASRELVQAEIERNDMSKGLIMARAMKTLRGLLTPKVMEDVMELQGTPLGFRTDKDTCGGYKPEAVRDLLIQALIRGLQPVGNQINIIAGNLYVTKEGFERLLREMPGLKSLSIQVGVPVTKDGGALVPCKASWKFNGVADELVCEAGAEADYRIAVKVNGGMGVDAIHGKAKSKLYRRIYERLTGTTVEDGEVDEGIVSSTATEIASGKQESQ